MRTVLLVIATTLVLVAAAAGPARGGNAGFATTADPAGATEVSHALGVLHGWDARRAAAWRHADAAALGSLYAEGATAGRADQRLLRAYAARDLVVRRIETQVFGVRVLHSSVDRLDLRVFDRVAGGEVASARSTERLASTRPVTHTVTFRRVDGAWLVSSVSARDPRAARR